MERNILLTIEYDGTNFSGWQIQPNAYTVQEEVQRVLSILCGEPITVFGTSRTDGGVHAYGQRANFSGDFGIPTEKIMFAANNLLDPSVRIKKVELMPLDFHARYHSKSKTYIYRIANGRYGDPFKRNYCCHVDRPLNFEDMKKAGEYLVGTHDFESFQSTGGTIRTTTVRTIYSLDLVKEGDEITMTIHGDGFLYNMVRIIAGTLIKVGLGKIQPDAMEDIIKSKDRRKAGLTASPNGLYLAEIYY